MSKTIIAIRTEDKTGERRTPLVPQDIQTLITENGLSFIVQSSSARIFQDNEYQKAGAKIEADTTQRNLILGIKEVPVNLIEKQKTYLFFSHTIKGQAYNMPLLAKIISQKATLLDYERIVDEKNRRLIFFGQEAGQAGMINTLWAFGQRSKLPGFKKIKQAYQYADLKEALQAISRAGKDLDLQAPLIIGIAGYGHVSQGAQKILDQLPVIEISPEDIPKANRNKIYKVVFQEEHMVEPIAKDSKFELQDYYDNPEKYRSKFQNYLPYLNILVNCIYWAEKYPRFVTKKDDLSNLQVIGDITCDINGAIEFTVKSTTSDNPVFVYDQKSDNISDGLNGNGVVVMAIDNLPSELPKDASNHFSQMLKKYLPALAQADFTGSFNKLNLPAELKRAIIVYQGELTPEYIYLNKYLQAPSLEGRG